MTGPAYGPAAGLPLHLQVEGWLLERIQSGEWQAGERIPTEEQLCAAYSVSRITVRQALGRLTDRGLLVRQRGRGTFVRDPAVTADPRRVTSLTTELEQLGLVAGGRVLDTRVVEAGAEDAEALGCGPGEPLLRVRRLRTGDGKPIGLQTSLLPAKRFPGLEEIDLTDRSLYATLRSRYGAVPREAVETFTVGRMAAADARLLDVPAHTCAFLVERVTFDHRGAFERVHSVLRGDRYRIRLRLRNS